MGTPEPSKLFKRHVVVRLASRSMLSADIYLEWGQLFAYLGMLQIRIRVVYNPCTGEYDEASLNEWRVKD